MNAIFDMKLATQPLHIETCKTERQDISVPATQDGLSSALQQAGLSNATAIFWQVHQVTCARVEGSALFLPAGVTLRPKLLLECRIFNVERELWMQQQDGQLVGRCLIDTDGDSTSYVDSLSRLWGERSSSDVGAGWMKLIDRDRKLSMILPTASETAKYYGLVMRSYIGVHPKTAQAGYVDFRYAAIVPADADEERKGRS